MSKPDHARPSEPRAERAELVRLVRRIQALTLELQEPRRRELDQADVEAKEPCSSSCVGDSPQSHDVPQPMSSATPMTTAAARTWTT
jgi:hypothetical protein